MIYDVCQEFRTDVVAVLSKSVFSLFRQAFSVGIFPNPLADSATGQCRAAIALELQPTRALPGHVVARGHRLGASLVGPAGDAVFERLRTLASKEPRLLRVNLEFSLLNPEDHRRVGATLQRLGFSRATTTRNYRSTLVVALESNEEALLAGFSATARRDLRQWSQRPVELRPVTDPGLAGRLDAARETFSRTGGLWQARRWKERMELCAKLPDRSRLIGLFRSDRDDDEGLIAYAGKDAAIVSARRRRGIYPRGGREGLDGLSADVGPHSVRAKAAVDGSTWEA